MSRFICSICGYVHEDSSAPENCPVCMAPASEFSEIKEVSPTDNDPIDKDEVEEIIENEGEIKDHSPKTIESLLEENTNNTVESSEATKTINNTEIQGVNNENFVGANEKLDLDEEAILKKYQGNPAAMLELVKWYKETYQVGLKEAKDRVDFVLDKHGLQSLSKSTKSGSGCMITILIAISSTLSAFFLL